MTGAVSIEARSLGFRYPGAAWLYRDLTFSLGAGEVLVLLGRNGRGKTTLLKCLAGLVRPSGGSLRCAGATGYVPQQFSSPFAYSVFELVLMGRARHLGLFSNPTAEDRARAGAALDLVGLGAFAGRSVATLSGGERQLVLIARALASEADILLLDEPASALDFRNQAVVLAMLRRLAKERGLTIVMTTHEPTHALEVADRAVLLHGGGRCEEGPMAQVCTEAGLSALYGIAMKRVDYRIGERDAANIVASYGSLARGP